MKIHGKVSDMESCPAHREGAGESVKLPELLRRAVFDEDVRNLLFDDPLKAVEAYLLSENDAQKLINTSRADFESMLGKFVTYKILPTPIGDRLLIKPVNGMVLSAEGRLEIILDQSATGANLGASGTSKNTGRVFGCGTHPTTRLCVHMIERYLKPGMRFLDVGTGSGILALAAAKLGAHEVIGVDVDPKAIAEAQANMQLNDLGDCIDFAVGDASWATLKGVEPFDLVVSNILADVHLQSLGRGLLSTLRRGGRLILSGMYRAGASKVAQSLERMGWKVVEFASIGPWTAIMAEEDTS